MKLHSVLEKHMKLFISLHWTIVVIKWKYYAVVSNCYSTLDSLYLSLKMVRYFASRTYWISWIKIYFCSQLVFNCIYFQFTFLIAVLLNNLLFVRRRKFSSSNENVNCDTVSQRCLLSFFICICDNIILNACQTLLRIVLKYLWDDQIF